MNDFGKEDLEKSLVVITSLLNKCEKAQERLAQGTSQWTLLKNRINALHLSVALITKELTKA